MRVLREKNKEHMIGLLLFSFSILCFGEEIGQYYSAFNRVCGGLFLLLYLILNLVSWGMTRESKGFRVNFIATLVLTLLAFGSSIAVISVGLVLIISGLWQKRDEFNVGLIFFLYLLLKSYLPLFYYIEQGVAEGLNYLLNLITPLEINYSAAAYGLGWMLIIFSLELCLLNRINLKLWQKIIQIIFIFCCILTLQGLYFWLATKFIALAEPYGYNLDYYLYYLVKHFVPMNGHLLMFAIIFSVTAFSNKRLSMKHGSGVSVGKSCLFISRGAGKNPVFYL